MLLLIPGPVLTRPEVRAAAAADIAPWDMDFRPVYAGMRQRLLAIAGGVAGTHTMLPLPGGGHFVTEASLRTFIPLGGRILIPMTGGYAESMVRLAREAGRVPVPLPITPLEQTDPVVAAAALANDPTITHVGQVQSETATGIVHDIDAIGAVVHAAGRRMIVDAVSAFGALPMDLSAHPEIDSVVFTPNKCLEALPGLGFAAVNIARIEQSRGNAGSWSFDLCDLYAQVMTRGDGRPRFTPPVQVIAALTKALDFFDAEGGRVPRLERYYANMRTFRDGMVRIGLEPFAREPHQGPILVTVHAPNDPNWDLQRFVDALKARGVLISNFYHTPTPGFRVGCIGAIGPSDMDNAVVAMDQALKDIGVTNRERAPT